jgi:RNA-binding protein
MPLTTKQIRYLKGLGHNLNPVVTIADKGLTENVLVELEATLSKHELIKVKLRVAREERKQFIKEISRLCKAEKIQAIGQVACFFRRNAENPVIALPGKS